MAFVYVAPRSHTPGRCAPPGAKLVPALVPCYFLVLRGVIRSVFGTRTGPPTNCISSVPPPQARGGRRQFQSECIAVYLHHSQAHGRLGNIIGYHRSAQVIPCAQHPSYTKRAVGQSVRRPSRPRDTGANDGETRGATGQSTRHHPARTRR
jgi:hypothetical protein